MPYLLAAGIDARSIAFTGAPALVVAGTNGDLTAIHGDGTTAALGPGAGLVQIDIDGANALVGVTATEILRFDTPGGSITGRLRASAVDIAPACEGTYRVAAAHQLASWRPGTATVPFGPPLDHPIVGAAWGGCDRTLVWGPDGVWWVHPASLEAVGPDLPGPVHGAAWNWGAMVVVAHGDPPLLTAVRSDGTARITGLPAPPRDLRFGVGGLFPTENLYLAETGAITYTRP